MPASIKPDRSNVRLRSVSVQEFISNKPDFYVRWGISIFALLIVLVCLVCWFIQYPEVVRSRGVIASINPPKPVICKAEGKLVKLFAFEGQDMKKGQAIGFIESTADHEQVLILAANLDKAAGLVEGARLSEIPSLIEKNYTNLGELQGAYQSFMQSYMLFKGYLPQGIFFRKLGIAGKEIQNLHKQEANILSQKALQEKDLKLFEQTYEVNKQLNQEHHVSDIDMRSEESRLIAKQLSLPQMNAALLSNENQRTQKEREIIELKDKYLLELSAFAQSLYALRALVEDWKQKFVLSAPVDGKLVFSFFVDEQQQLKAGQQIAFINPGSSKYYAQVLIPQENLAKIKLNQQVLIKLPAYPSQEYGHLNGNLSFISPVSTDSGYLGKVTLPAELVTNYQKKVQYREGLVFSAEIITSNKRLLERFYGSLLKSIKAD